MSFARDLYEKVRFGFQKPGGEKAATLAPRIGFAGLAAQHGRRLPSRRAPATEDGSGHE